MRALLSAAGLLTVLPIRGGRFDRRSAPAMMVWAPVAVLPIAILVAAVIWGVRLLHAPAAVAGLLGVATLALGTRAFHLDGLADTVDGFGSGWDRDRALSIMRRGDVGPMGVTAMIITVGLQAYGFGVLAEDATGALVVAVIICLSRTALAVSCARSVPSARPDGLGATVAGSIPVPAAVIIGLVSIMVLAVAGALDRGPSGAQVGVIAAMAGYTGCMLLVRHAIKRFGGVTGDVLGAAVEITATIMAAGMILSY
ncbi:adenosylcobinamide-GDP ribazoletransferase [Microlunatus sp. Gsoil 973]|uniref:adenosylcobinamide-GDP ribazoletransferase n=1 Tax=Microlunatus sp. Gsoil 973 TaxID=2672569 RepID=UPI0012B4C7CD|nr:adenosylcobinamide-GDP ribazoletransferase [Microlunatus sp. Gsoil 973]QGN33080.1 adenosylcobinamide-GDP ribazoletransferase [Microlunatus sp. Gsoil 973]